MLSINKEILKVSKKKNLYKLFKDLSENKDIDTCLLLNKSIDLNELRKHLSILLNIDVDISNLILQKDSKTKYYYINNAETFNDFVMRKLTFVLVPMNEKFLKEECIYKIDSLSDLPSVETSEDTLPNRFGRLINMERIPAVGHINIDPNWKRSIEVPQFPTSRQITTPGTFRYDRRDNTLTYTSTRLNED